MVSTTLVCVRWVLLCDWLPKSEYKLIQMQVQSFSSSSSSEGFKQTWIIRDETSKGLTSHFYSQLLSFSQGIKKSKTILDLDNRIGLCQLASLHCVAIFCCLNWFSFFWGCSCGCIYFFLQSADGENVLGYHQLNELHIVIFQSRNWTLVFGLYLSKLLVEFSGV